MLNIFMNIILNKMEYILLNVGRHLSFFLKMSAGNHDQLKLIVDRPKDESVNSLSSTNMDNICFWSPVLMKKSFL